MEENKKTTQELLESFSMDINKRKIEVFEYFDKLFTIAKTKIDEALDDPNSIKASMMAELNRIMNNCLKMLKDADTFKKEIEAELSKIDPETQEVDETLEQTGMSTQESIDANNYVNSVLNGINPDLEQKKLEQDDLNYGMNFRRDT